MRIEEQIPKVDLQEQSHDRDRIMPAGDGTCIIKHCLGSFTIVKNIDAKINRAQKIYKVKRSTENSMEGARVATLRRWDGKWNGIRD